MVVWVWLLEEGVGAYTKSFRSICSFYLRLNCLKNALIVKKCGSLGCSFWDVSVGGVALVGVDEMILISG